MGRIPRISRLEYVADFLKATEEGLDNHGIEETLSRRKQFFEMQKYMVLGRGAPFGEKQKKRLMITRSTRAECAKLCVTLGLIGADERLTSLGNRVCSLSFPEQTAFIGKLFLSAYEDSRNLLFVLNKLTDHEIALPDRHSLEYGTFKDSAHSYGLDIDSFSFDAMRDLLWQIGYVNWLPERRNHALWSTVYLTSLIAETDSEDEGPSVFNHEGKAYVVRLNDIDNVRFKTFVWNEYLKKTNDVQLRPVFYSDLRTAVCRRLRLSDGIFDSHLRDLMAEESEYRVVWSSGTMPYSRDSASLLKNLPPKTADDQYMVYLKIGRR